MNVEVEDEFIPDPYRTVVLDVLTSVLGTHEFSEEKIPEWISQITESCLKKFVSINEEFKYGITIILQQHTGAFLHVASSQHWNILTDGAMSMHICNDNIDCK